MERKMSWRLIILGALFIAILTFLAMGTAVSAFGAQTAYSGDAAVVRADVLGFASVHLVEAGPLPTTGGEEGATLMEATAPGLLTAEVLHASTIGQGKASRSEASIANVRLTVAGHTIMAGFLMAKAAAECKQGAAAVSGGSEIADLIVDGQHVTVATSPNQTIPLVGTLGVEVGRVVINEQKSFVNGGRGDVEVNALHVVVDGIADIVISHTHADIDCAGENPGKDFVTGGGWISGTPSGGMANFGVAGGIRAGTFWGHLTYLDHGWNMKVKGTSVTVYKVVNETMRHIEGLAEVNGQAGYMYSVDVTDNGEPGINDKFSISLSDGYHASGQLAGGNIQIHTP